MGKKKATALVVRQGKKLVTTSRIVAMVFEKSHSVVVRAVENSLSDMSDVKFGINNFAQMNYTDSGNRTQTEWVMTEDGFAVVAMGFTGKKALDLRVSFVEAFRLARERHQSLLRSDPDWQEGRKVVSILQRSMTDKLMAARALAGKPTHSHHYMNENLLLTYALVGKSKPPIERGGLDTEGLKKLAQVEELNGSLILSGMEYEQRKDICRSFIVATEKAKLLAA